MRRYIVFKDKTRKNSSPYHEIWKDETIRPLIIKKVNLSKFDKQNFVGNLKRSHRSETKFVLNDMLFLAKPPLVYLARF